MHFPLLRFWSCIKVHFPVQHFQSTRHFISRGDMAGVRGVAMQKGVRRLCPPIVDWVGFLCTLFSKVTLFSLKCSVGLKYGKNALAAGTLPRGPSWGSLHRFPRPHSRLGRWTIPPQSPPPSAPLATRFSRLRRSANSVAPM